MKGLAVPVPAPNYTQDAERVFRTLRDGGIAIVPTSIGYAIVGGTSDAIRRAHKAKGRAPSKYNAFTGSQALHEEVHILDGEKRAMVRMLTIDYDLPVGTIAPCRKDHPIFRNLDADVYEQSTYQDTAALLLNGGPLLKELGRLSHEHGIGVIGSSANRSLQGTKFRVSDIEPEVVAEADEVIDYGLVRWAAYGKSSTMIDFATMKATRVGACYDLISDVLLRHFGVTLTTA
jgi:tRNA A37 threonylcarbamoyladenosine synthetase subunit TsaC/SUA5/YrdC